MVACCQCCFLGCLSTREVGPSSLIVGEKQNLAMSYSWNSKGWVYPRKVVASLYPSMFSLIPERAIDS